jgi:hypothetical protein
MVEMVPDDKKMLGTCMYPKMPLLSPQGEKEQTVSHRRTNLS